MFFIDRVFLTWYSTDALAASMQSSMLNWTISSLGIGTVSYVNSFVAQYHGAGRPDRISGSIWQAFYASLILSVLTLIMAVGSWWSIPLFGHAAEVTRLETEYFSLLFLASVPSIISTGFSAFYSGRGETLTVMYVNIVMLAVNVVLDYAMIFGWGPIPEMGIRGAGLATILSTLTGLVLYVALLSRRREREEFGFWKNRGVDRELLKRLFRYGFPSGMQMFGDALAFTLFLFFVGQMGRDEQAATNLAFNLNSLVFIPMLGLGTAVTVMVGKRIGEGRADIAAVTTWKAFWATSAYVLLFAYIYLFLPDVILAPFKARANQEEFIRIEPLVRQLLVFVVLYTLSDAMAVIFGSAVRAAGDTRFSFIITFVSGWLLMVLPVGFAAYTGRLTLTICWVACSAHIIFLGAAFLVRFLQGRWRSMKVIEDFDWDNREEPSGGAPPVRSPSEAARAAGHPTAKTLPIATLDSKDQA
jgi:MATE family multidrug resistance protein